MVESVVETALRYPEIPLQDDSEEKEKDRIACSANLVHQVNFYNHHLHPSLSHIALGPPQVFKNRKVGNLFSRIKVRNW